MPVTVDVRGVGDQQAEGQVAVPAVEPGEPLESEGRVEPRLPRHEQELPEDEVGPDQPGDTSGRVQPITRAAVLLQPGGGPPEAEDDQEVEDEGSPVPAPAVGHRPLSCPYPLRDDRLARATPQWPQ